MKDLSDIAAPGNSGLPWTILGTRSPQRYWLAGAQVPARPSSPFRLQVVWPGRASPANEGKAKGRTLDL